MQRKPFFLKPSSPFTKYFNNMSLAALPLDPYLLAKMYTQPLIPEVKQDSANLNGKKLKLRFLGENQKNICLLIQNKENAFLNEELFNFLVNILNACKLSMADVALINAAHYPDTPIAVLAAMAQARQVIVFGSGLTENELGMPVYTQVPVGPVQWLIADPLEVIASDKQRKAQLWNGLKQVFGI